MALNGVSGEFGVEVFCGGLGRTHFVVDIQGLPVDLDLPDLTLRCGSLSVGIAVNAVQ